MSHRIHLSPRLTTFMKRKAAQLRVKNSTIVSLALDYFWANHPMGGHELFLLTDDSSGLYAVVRQQENGRPVLIEIARTTALGRESLLETLRERYPDLTMGECNAVRTG